MLGFTLLPTDFSYGLLTGTGSLVAQVPNMRLKLPGAIVLMESVCLCAGAHELTFNDTAPGGRVARSLSAIR